jgi:hypothetical protein
MGHMNGLGSEARALNQFTKLTFQSRDLLE